MPRCIVKTAAVEEEVNQKTGAIIRSQYVDLDLGNGHALPFRVGLGKSPAYKPGEYDIDPKSFALNEYGNLTMKRYYDLVEVGARPAAK
jgi:hypothetical protein